MRARVAAEWAAAPKKANNIAPQLKAAAEVVAARLHANIPTATAA